MGASRVKGPSSKKRTIACNKRYNMPLSHRDTWIATRVSRSGPGAQGQVQPSAPPRSGVPSGSTSASRSPSPVQSQLQGQAPVQSHA